MHRLQLEHRLRRVRHAPGQTLIEGRRGRVHISHQPRCRALPQLRRHIRSRTSRRHHRLGPHREPEPADLDVPLPRDQHAGGLEVPVRHSGLGRGAQPEQRAAQHRQRRLRRQRTRDYEHPPQCCALHGLRDECQFGRGRRLDPGRRLVPRPAGPAPPGRLRRNFPDLYHVRVDQPRQQLRVPARMRSRNAASEHSLRDPGTWSRPGRTPASCAASTAEPPSPASPAASPAPSTPDPGVPGNGPAGQRASQLNRQQFNSHARDSRLPYQPVYRLRMTSSMSASRIDTSANS